VAFLAGAEAAPSTDLLRLNAFERVDLHFGGVGG
jgi:hypothetical protein